jgi:hypothetical protein
MSWPAELTVPRLVGQDHDRAPPNRHISPSPGHDPGDHKNDIRTTRDENGTAQRSPPFAAEAVTRRALLRQLTSGSSGRRGAISLATPFVFNDHRGGRAVRRRSASRAARRASSDNAGPLTPSLLLSQERGHQARADAGFRSGRPGGRRTGRCTRRPLPVRPGGAGPQPRALHVDRVSMTGRQPAAVL